MVDDSQVVEPVSESEDAARLREELAAARLEIDRLKSELTSARRRTDLFQSLGDFRDQLVEQLNLQSRFETREKLLSLLSRDLPFPKKRQVFAVSLIFTSLPGSMLLTLYLFWYALFRETTRILLALLVIYALHIFFDKTMERGANPKAWAKGHAIWEWFVDYFPVELRLMNPDTKFSPENVYLFGYHPHGVISVGCFANFAASVTGFSTLFPGLQIRVATLAFNFNVPFFREILLRMGVIAVSAKSIRHVLSSGPGSAVIIVPGGAAEALDARPGAHDLTLQKRSGFFRIALQHGAHLVPTYSFGENELYEQVPNKPGSALRRVQEYLLRSWGYSIPYFFGAGSSQTCGAVPFNPVPRRCPVITIVGNPIACEQIDSPSTEQIEDLKELYISRVQEIFNRFADEYAPDRTGELRIVQ